MYSILFLERGVKIVSTNSSSDDDRDEDKDAVELPQPISLEREDVVFFNRGHDRQRDRTRKS